jgi:hypothetical protein
MSSLRVLITSLNLSSRGGAPLYVKDLATALIDRGHKPVVYSLDHGRIAQELRAATVPVIKDLNLLSTPPDIIHGNQQVETMIALLHFSQAPAVYFCHGWMSWLEGPPRFPRILRYVAVSNFLYDRLVCEHGIPERIARVILNFVDLDRFKPRGPLPEKPKRALVFSNYANERTHLRAVREACVGTGIDLDVIGAGVGNTCEKPELELGKYDIVFAKGRAAIEALAVGTAVVLCDAEGAGPMVTTHDLDRLRSFNFGVRVMRDPLCPKFIRHEIERYNPQDAAEVSRRIRATAGRDAAVDQVVDLYREVIAEYKEKGPFDISEEGRAAAAYLQQVYADFMYHRALTSRLRSRLLKVPLLGPLLVSLRDRRF